MAPDSTTTVNSVTGTTTTPEGTTGPNTTDLGEQPSPTAPTTTTEPTTTDTTGGTSTVSGGDNTSTYSVDEPATKWLATPEQQAQATSEYLNSYGYEPNIEMSTMADLQSGLAMPNRTLEQVKQEGYATLEEWQAAWSGASEADKKAYIDYYYGVSGS